MQHLMQLSIMFGSFTPRKNIFFYVNLYHRCSSPSTHIVNVQLLFLIAVFWFRSKLYICNSCLILLWSSVSWQVLTQGSFLWLVPWILDMVLPYHESNMAALLTTRCPFPSSPPTMHQQTVVIFVTRVDLFEGAYQANRM